MLFVEALDINGRTAKAEYEYSYDGIAVDFLIDNADLKIVASDLNRCFLYEI
ncbi:MAG: hypothetical protein HFJ50_01790 [Clostridia bacterium]|nr:hypothetical protein [Clostridia bacterium]